MSTLSLISNCSFKKKGITYRIRKMIPEDLERILSIEQRSFPTPWSRKTFEKHLLEKYEKLDAFVLCNEEIIGYLAIWQRNENRTHIGNIAVRKSRRKEGFGSKLVSFALEFGSKEDCEVISLDVRKSNKPAIKLYEKFDFRVLGTKPGYYKKSGDDALLMARYI